MQVNAFDNNEVLRTTKDDIYGSRFVVTPF